MALISPISAGVTPSVSQIASTAGSSIDTSTARSAGADDFQSAISGALEDLNSKQLHADQLARDAATGNLQSIEDYMIAASDAQLSTQLTVAVRNKAVDAFNEIMRMQV